MVPARRAITIRDLLTHTSGVSYGSGSARDKWTTAGFRGGTSRITRRAHRGEHLRLPGSCPFDAQPGDEVDLRLQHGHPSARSSRRRGGQPLECVPAHEGCSSRSACATRISRADAGRSNVSRRSTPLRTSGIERAPTPGTMTGQGAYVEGPRKSFSGGAGLVSTASDYARFLQMMLNGGTLDGVRLLSRTTVGLMTTNHLGGQGVSPRSGLRAGASPSCSTSANEASPGSVGEYGWGGAYHSTYWVDPKEELVVVYLTQLVPAGDVDDQAKVRALVYQAIAD